MKYLLNIFIGISVVIVSISCSRHSGIMMEGVYLNTYPIYSKNVGENGAVIVTQRIKIKHVNYDDYLISYSPYSRYKVIRANILAEKTKLIYEPDSFEKERSIEINSIGKKIDSNCIQYAEISSNIKRQCRIVFDEEQKSFVMFSIATGSSEHGSKETKSISYWNKQ